MARSKLELYVNILEVLAVHGPLRVTRITLKARVNYVLLKRVLDDLIGKSLIEDRKLKDGEVVFAATTLGRRVLKQYKQFAQPNLMGAEETAQGKVALALNLLRHRR